MPVTISISPSELLKLRNHILAGNIKTVRPRSEYELLRIEDEDLSVVVYKSGKLVHNDTEASRRLIDRILERERDYDFLLGSDEVGKGEWYGPLVVVCAALSADDIMRFRKIGVRDSKAIGKTDLDKLALLIIKSGITYHDVTLMPETYNRQYEQFSKERKTLNDLLAWCHAAAIRTTLAKVFPKRIKGSKIVIDKFDPKKMDLRLEAAGIKDEEVEIIQSSKGDEEVPVSVASIIAKYLFELRVDELNRQFNVDLRISKPTDLNPKILPQVAKMHFKNVGSVGQNSCS